MKALYRFFTIGVTLSLLSLFLNLQNGAVPGQSLVTDAVSPDHLNTTVVILNWSRLENVKQIVSQICASLLVDVVRSITIWNNNPNALSFAHDFNTTSCPSDRLEIMNSPENLYFQARYLACARALTPYCFIQDDDFLVRPEIIKSLHARISEASSVSSIHIQPADELLTSELRTICIDDGAFPVHTTFAWLGYGALIRRTQAVEFLQLLHKLGLSDEERKMADNYFTILRNDVPERWFDAGIPLGGGQPFTVGQEGEDRNNHHIVRATELLQSISEMDEAARNELPYLSLQKKHPHPHAMLRESESHRTISRAPSHGTDFLLETSIALLPDNVWDHNVVENNPSVILSLEKLRREALGEGRIDTFVRYPLSNAVDGDIATVFRSPDNAKAGDWIGVNLLTTRHYAKLRLVLLVDQATEAILRKATLEISVDGSLWIDHFAKLICLANELDDKMSHVHGNIVLKRCSFITENVRVRSARLRVSGGMDENWGIYEVFIN